MSNTHTKIKVKNSICARFLMSSIDPDEFIKRKTPKNSPISSPKSGDEGFNRSGQRKKSLGRKNMDVYNMMQQLSSMMQGQEPSILKTTEKDAIEMLIKEFNAYLNSGGSKKLKQFIDPPLLDGILQFELKNRSAKDEEIYNYLSAEYSRVKSVSDIEDALNSCKIKIDENATTGPKRILSLMTSFNREIGKLNLPEEATNQDTLILPFKEKKKFIISKLPKDFQAQFNQHAKFHKKIATMDELYDQLRKVEKKYSGSWDIESCAFDSDDQSMYSSLQDQHSRRQLRSSTKKA